jgi:photosystem II stability/assembly factor-like uncharacterized protein
VRLALFALALAIGACGPSRHGAIATAPPPRPKEQERVAPAAATWALRYEREGKVAVALDGGVRVEVGRNGERWSFGARGHERSETFFPEPIVCASRAGGELAFVGASGAVHPVSARAPLGEIGPARRPAFPVGRVACGKHAVVVESKGEILRSLDAGRNWSRVAIDVEPRVLASLAMTPEGTGAIVALPQRSLVTADDGATWTHIAPPPEGIAKVKTDGGRVLTESVLGDASSELASDPLRWIAAARRSEPTNEAAGLDFEYAVAASRGAGVVAGTHWIEVVATERGYELWLEDMGARGPPRRLRSLAECRSDTPSVGASDDGRAIVVACRRSNDATDVVVDRSDDGGANWTTDPPLRAAGPLRVAVRRDETTAIAGACTTNDDPCPLAIVVGGPRSLANVDVEPSGSPIRGAAVEHVALTADGFVGLGSADDKTIAVLSRDGGRSARVVRRFDAYHVVDELSIDGRRGTAVIDDATSRLLVTDDGGESWREKEVGPFEAIAFAGARGLAVREGGVLETLDAGDTWSRVEAPIVTSPSLRCGRGACIVDRCARRIGWGAPEIAPAATSEASAAAEPIAPNAPALRCRATGAARTLAGSLDAPLVDLDGGVRWMAVARDPKKGAMQVLVDRSSVGDRRLVREASPSIPVPPAPTVFDVATSEYGVAFVEYPGRCALNCHGHLYTASGPIVVTWVSAKDPRGVLRVAVTPGPGARDQDVAARVLADGTALVAVGDETYVVASGGVRQTLKGRATDLVRIDGKTFGVSDALVLRDGSGVTTAWALRGEDTYDDRFGIVTTKTQPVAWTQIGASVLLVKLDRVEVEPSSVARVDAAKLLASPAASACSTYKRERVRVPYAPKRPIPIALEGEDDLGVDAAVVRVGADGAACVSALVATSKAHGVAVAIAPDDLDRATVFRFATTRAPATIQQAICR